MQKNVTFFKIYLLISNKCSNFARHLCVKAYGTIFIL